MSVSDLHHFRAAKQYVLQIVQVFFVGLTLGTTRTVVPAVAETDFGVPRGDLALIAAFVMAFGLVKAAMNFIAGALSETHGRKRLLVVGWVIALPVPWLIWIAPSWWFVVLATALLGVNQGLTWSMTLTSKLDLASAKRRGLANGINEFAGYSAVAIAGVVTAMLADRMGSRTALLLFGYGAIVPALLMAATMVHDTRLLAHSATVSFAEPMAMRVVVTRSFTDARFFALCQCGLVEKFVDCLAWIALPIVLIERGVRLEDVGWIPGAYAATWGCLQIVTGPLSDRLGRTAMIVAGMLTCAVGLFMLPQLESLAMMSVCAAMIGAGMAMLYPTLGAAVSDLAPPSWRATALGVYRCWRDAGYAVGALAIAALAVGGVSVSGTFPILAGAIALSGISVAMLRGEANMDLRDKTA